MIQKEYGLHVFKFLRVYIKSVRKISRTNEHIIFNQRCRRYKIIPKCLRARPAVRTSNGYQIAQQTAFKYLSARIEDCHHKIRQLDTDCYFQLRQLEYVLLPLHLQAVKEHAHNIKQDEKNKCKSRQKNKFQKLLAEQTRTGYQRNWVINLSSKIITDQQKSVLSKGLNFAPTPRQIPIPRIVANIETALKSSKADPQTTSQARSRIVGILSKSPKLTPNLSPAES